MDATEIATRPTPGSRSPVGRDRAGKRPARLRQKIGPYSKEGVLARIDKRCREALFLRRMTEELIEHVGGNPSAAQRALIERAAMLSLRLAMLDQRVITDTMSSEVAGEYLAWSNSLTRTMCALGLEAVQQRPSLAQYLSQRKDSDA
jgi:hypothetical protein